MVSTGVASAVRVTAAPRPETAALMTMSASLRLLKDSMVPAVLTPTDRPSMLSLFISVAMSAREVFAATAILMAGAAPIVTVMLPPTSVATS